MPVLPPAAGSGIGSFTTIGSLVGGIPNKYGNRQDFNTIADGSKPVTAVLQAIRELTETYEFEELKYQTPVPPSVPLQMATANPFIPISTILATIPGNVLYPQFQTENIVDITDVYSFWMWFSGGVNQAGRLLQYRRVPTVDEDSYGITSSQQGAVGVAPPVYYTRFNNNLQVGPAPDNPYTYFVRVKIRHPYPFVAPFVPAVFGVTVTGGSLTLTVVNGGSNYLPNQTAIPLYSPAPIGGTAMVGTAQSNNLGVITGVTITSGGSGYTQQNAQVFTAVIASQEVFVPDSWWEIIEYAACWRLATNSGEVEYIEMFDNILKSKGVDIAEARAVKSQMKRDERHNQRGLSLRLGSPYTFAR